MKRRSVRDVLDNPKPEKEFYVLVTRHYPMELRKRGLTLEESPINAWSIRDKRDLAPSRELLNDYKTGKITWEQYVERFKTEVPPILAIPNLEWYQNQAAGKELVLVCVEEDIEYPKCHTYILLDYWKQKKAKEIPPKKMPPKKELPLGQL